MYFLTLYRSAEATVCNAMLHIEDICGGKKIATLTSGAPCQFEFSIAILGFLRDLSTTKVLTS
jgi:hypothetical protein